MKFLLLVLVVIGVLWLMRSRRKPDLPPTPARPLAKSEEMVACRHCGVHLPRSEALPGRGGVFCGEAHRSASEKESKAP